MAIYTGGSGRKCHTPVEQSNSIKCFAAVTPTQHLQTDIALQKRSCRPGITLTAAAAKKYADSTGSGDRSFVEACVNALRTNGRHYVLSPEENDSQMAFDFLAGKTGGAVTSYKME